jgi:hypothetical protein
MPKPAITPDRIVQIGGEIRARAIREGEKSFVSEWLKKSDLRLERPVLPTPPQPPAAFEEVPSPLSVTSTGDLGERSLVSDWLRKSDLELGREEPLEDITTWRPPEPDAPPKAIAHPRPPQKRAAVKAAKASTAAVAAKQPPKVKPGKKPAPANKPRPKISARSTAKSASRSKAGQRAAKPKKPRARTKPKKKPARRGR